MSKMKNIAIDQMNAEREGQILRDDGSVLANIDFVKETIAFSGVIEPPIVITFDDLERLGNSVFAWIMSRYEEEKEKEWKKTEEELEGIGIIKFKR